MRGWSSPCWSGICTPWASYRSKIEGVDLANEPTGADLEEITYNLRLLEILRRDLAQYLQQAHRQSPFNLLESATH
jgi:hypothetical protein